MANLISRVQEVSRNIRDLEGLKATEEEARQFETRANELSGLAEMVQPSATLIGMFRGRGIAVETPKAQAYQLRLKLEAFQQAYAADRKSILGPSREWRFNTKPGLEQTVKISLQQLQEAWRSHLAEMRPASDTGLLRLLSRSGAFQTRSRKISELLSEFDIRAIRLPSNMEELERPSRLAEELNLLTRELPGDIPEPVQRLFQSMEEGSATAAQLTGDTMQWLLENKMLSDVQVSWRRN